MNENHKNMFVNVFWLFIGFVTMHCLYNQVNTKYLLKCHSFVLSEKRISNYIQNAMWLLVSHADHVLILLKLSTHLRYCCLNLLDYFSLMTCQALQFKSINSIKSTCHTKSSFLNKYHECSQFRATICIIYQENNSVDRHLLNLVA